MEVRSIEAIVRALNESAVRYLVVGGLAVNAHGYERLTRDLDLVIGLEPDNIVRGLEVLMAIGYKAAIPITAAQFADASLREQWMHDKSMLVLKLCSDLHSRTPVDVFVYEPFAFEAEHRRALCLEIAPGLQAPFVALDTLLAMKRQAGRAHDLADIAGLEEARRLSDTDAHGSGDQV